MPIRTLPAGAVAGVAGEAIHISWMIADFVEDALGITAVKPSTDDDCSALLLKADVFRTWFVNAAKGEICGRSLGYYSRDLDHVTRRLEQLIAELCNEPHSLVLAGYE